jgi:hypothetical protein
MPGESYFYPVPYVHEHNRLKPSEADNLKNPNPDNKLQLYNRKNGTYDLSDPSKCCQRYLMYYGGNTRLRIQYHTVTFVVAAMRPE